MPLYEEGLFIRPEKWCQVYDNAPEERQRHLARLISESYLAKGNTAKAKEYYDVARSGDNDMDRNDYFYAGSLLYATEDYKGAIENYSLMRNRTDSIGQIANYHLAYSYIQTGNKVAALDAFKAASERAYNPDIQEDAHFNYAKLSFDLNHNPSVFNDYLAKYPTRRRERGSTAIWRWPRSTATITPEPWRHIPT